MQEGKPRVMSVPEAGRLLDVSRNTAYELARTGQIPVIRLNRRLVVPVDAFERWLQSATDFPLSPSDRRAQ